MADDDMNDFKQSVIDDFRAHEGETRQERAVPVLVLDRI